MNTATQVDLEILEQVLEINLHSELLPSIPLQVSCVLQNSTLVVVVQHPEPLLRYPKQLFRFLQKMLQDEELITGTYKVLMYIRLMGQHQPYAFHTATIQSSQSRLLALEDEAEETNLEEEAVELNLEQDIAQAVGATERFFLHEDEFTLEEDEEVAHSYTINSEGILDLEDEEESDYSHDGDLEDEEESDSSYDGDLEDEEDEVLKWQIPASFGFEVEDGFEDPEPPRETPSVVRPKQESPWQPLILAGAGVSAIVFFSSFYLLTRPCVLESCEAIPQAQQFAQASEAILSQPLSGQEILQAQKQLETSIELLESIPPWSRNHTEAQDLLQIYESRSNTLENVVEALQTAARAGYASQNPPLPVSQWQKSQELWRNAIAQLEAIPPESEFYDFAQGKLPTYNSNLASINARLNSEQQAVQSLQAAQQAIEIAEAREGTALSLSNWQLVDATWQTVLQRLEEIPQETTAYEKAQGLRERYTPKINAIQERKNRELFASNVYERGIQFAQVAKNSESMNSWGEAVINWRNALAHVEQIPAQTFYTNKTQTLREAYARSLAQAEANLNLVVSRQQAQADLNQICAGGNSICESRITNSTIQVYLSPSYMQQVTQTAVNAEARNDVEAKVDLYNNIQTLDQAFKAVSRNAGLPLEIYTPDGALVKTINSQQ